MRILKRNIIIKNIKLKTQVVVFLGTVTVTLAVYFLTLPGDSANRNPARLSKGSTGIESLKDLKRKIINTLKVNHFSQSESEVSVILPAEICERYQRFLLVLEAEGAAVNGEPIRVTKTKSCTDLDPETLQMTWQVGRPDQPVLLDQTIKNWNIKFLSFEGAAQQKPLRISSFEIIYVLGAPVSVQIQ